VSASFERAPVDHGTQVIENSSIAVAMDILRLRPSMPILRDAFFLGITRIDDFVRRTNSTRAVVAARLKQLTELGLFTNQPYRDLDKRTRREYLLTEKGKDLLPAVFALMQWTSKYLEPNNGELPRLVQRGTGEPVTIVASAASGAELSFDDLAIVPDDDQAEPARN
jgi:DNA-binding HxlR family transcriptional regulator